MEGENEHLERLHGGVVCHEVPLHRFVKWPIAVNDQVVIRPMMYVALSYDHRLIDGVVSVKFLVRLKELLEDPARLMLEI